MNDRSFRQDAAPTGLRFVLSAYHYKDAAPDGASTRWPHDGARIEERELCGGMDRKRGEA